MGVEGSVVGMEGVACEEDDAMRSVDGDEGSANSDGELSSSK